MTTIKPGTRVEFGSDGHGTVLDGHSDWIHPDHRSNLYAADPAYAYVLYDEPMEGKDEHGYHRSTGGWFRVATLRVGAS